MTTLPTPSPRVAAPEAPPAPGASARPTWATLWPFLLVAFIVGINLWVLRAERLTVTAVNDQGVHRLLIDWARSAWADGRVPLDGWFPRLSAGLPEFRYYQVLPHILTGGVATAIGTDHAIAWTNYLGMALWPICIYLTVRIFGFGRPTAAITASLAPLISSVTLYGFEYGSYSWRGNGMWSQLWGMWLLPLTLAVTWRAVSRGHRYALAALLLALTLCSHFLTGTMALLGLGLWTLLAPREIPRRIGRAALVGLGGLAGAAWLLVPVIAGGPWGLSSQYNGDTFFFNSHGRSQVLSWLWRGELLDYAQDGRQRWPIITILLGVGIVLAVVRFARDERLRAFLLYFGLGFAFFSGKDTVGWVTGRLPGSDQLLLHRFHTMLQISGLLLAGVGASWLAHGLWRWVAAGLASRGERPAPDRPRWSRLRTSLVAATIASALVVAIAGVGMVQAWQERNAYMRLNGTWIEAQRIADAGPGRDFETLAREGATFGGRVYAGSASANSPYKILYAPTYMVLAHDDIDAIGFTLRTLSLTGDAEVKFNDQRPEHLDLFNVRALVLPSGVQPASALGATLVRTLGAWSLWSVSTTGYLRVVDTGPAIAADRTTLGRNTTDFMQGDAGRSGVIPLIAFHGEPSGTPTRFDPLAPERAPGTVDVQFARPDDGAFGGRVTLDRPGVVMLKATYNPAWEARVDGEVVPTQMLAPSFVGVPVPGGSHTVEFRYRNSNWSWPLLALGVLVLAARAVVPRVLDPRRRDRIASPPPPARASSVEAP